MSALDLLGLNRIFKGTVESRPTRKILRFLGGSVSVADNPALNSTDITIQGGTGLGNVTGPDPSVPGNVPTLANADGTLLADSGVALADLATEEYVDDAIAAQPSVAAGFVTVGADASLPNERVLMQGTGVTITDGGAGNAVTIRAQMAVRSSSATATTLADSDDQSLIVNTATALATFTLPPNAAVPLPIGFEVWIENNSSNASSVSVALGAGVTLTGTYSANFSLPYGKTCRLQKIGADQWLVNFLVSFATTVTTNAALTGTAGVDGAVSRGDHQHPHGVQTNTTLHALATSSAAGFMASGDKAWVDDAANTIPFVTIGNTGRLNAERALTAGAGLAQLDGGANAALTTRRSVAFNNQTTNTAYTLAASDDGKVIAFSSAGTVVTVPDDTVLFPVGGECWIQQSSGTPSQISIVAGGGVVLRTPSGLAAATRTAYGLVRLWKQSANYWILDGDLQDTRPYITLATEATLPNERYLGTAFGHSFADGGPSSPVYAAHTMLTATQTGSYTFSASDRGGMIQFNNAVTPGTFTIPAGLLPVGSEILVMQIAAQPVTIAAGASVTLTFPPGYNAKTRGVNAVLHLRNVRAQDVWTLTGDLEPNTAFVTVGNDASMPNDRALQAGAGLAIVDTGAGNNITLSRNILWSSSGVTAYSPVASDAGKQVSFANGATTITLPSDSTSFPVGHFVDFQQTYAPAGVISGMTFVAGPGATVYTPAGMSAATRATYSLVRALKLSPNSWILSGDLLPTSGFVRLGGLATTPNERLLTAGPGVAITDGGAGGAATVTAREGSFNWTSGGFGFNASHEDGFIFYTGIANNTLTVPTNAANALAVGFSARVGNFNSGRITVASAGVTLTWSGVYPGNSSLGYGDVVRFTKTGTDSWVATWESPPPVPIGTITSNLTLISAYNKWLIVAENHTSDITVTVPTDAAQPTVAVGFRCEIFNTGGSSAWSVNLSTTGLTVNGVDGKSITQVTINDKAILTKIAANRWLIQNTSNP